jgi:hypothetical protein
MLVMGHKNDSVIVVVENMKRMKDERIHTENSTV